MKNIGTLLLFQLLLFAALPCFAQQKAKFHIVSFAENPHDMSPKTHEKLDPDGHPYAIIKVKSNNPDDDLSAYSFNFEHIPHLVEAKDGELWVYVGRNAMYVNISRDGYHSIKRYDLGLTIQPGRAYDMRLSAESQKIMKQMVRFNISPVEAKAIIMYKSDRPGATEQLFGTADENGAVAKNLELGKYSYKIISDNCYPSEGVLILDNANATHTEDVVLRANFARVSLVAGNGVSIFVDGDNKGVGSWNGILKEGTYSIECRKAGHKSTIETLKIEEGKDVTLTLSNPEPITGTLSITSTPLDAVVTIDGKDYGLTPRNINDLIIGNHKVTVSKDGYLSQEFEVAITENEIFERSVELKQKQQDTVIKDQAESNAAVRKIGTLQSSGTINGHEYVDLGLPSGLKWATCNVGAVKPEDYGNYYAWGEIKTKEQYTERNNKTKRKKLDDISGKSRYDVAYADWGASWHMPTKADFEELLNNCSCEWAVYNGVYGCCITGRNGNRLFLPAAGYRAGTSLNDAKAGGHYWSSTSYESGIGSAYSFNFSSEAIPGVFHRMIALCVRPVTE
ncbi:MAG: PEGA domain-containing protein [Bacteroidaceae bacterium]|nr:PEGA domain-containing protein [Bacteroidaceae bacterium]